MTHTVAAAAPLLEVNELSVEFRSRGSVTHAVNKASFTVAPRETLAILGESGSGKSVTAQAIMGILDTPPAQITSGQVVWRGDDLLLMPEKQRRRLRGAHMSMIFQDSLSALNPVMSVGAQIAEMFRVHQGMGRKEAMNRAADLMDRVRIPDARKRVKDYPHQFSGGMRQRVMIAIAIALSPDLLIADEPTTALDVTVQAQIMHLLQELQNEMDMGLILITHDLGVVAEVADRIAVMYAGEVVESAAVGELFAHPAHPYTEALLGSIPTVTHRGERLRAIPGQPPHLTRLPVGCPFTPRCHRRDEALCPTTRPPLATYPGEDGIGERTSRCHFADQVLGIEEVTSD